MCHGCEQDNALAGLLADDPRQATCAVLFAEIVGGITIAGAAAAVTQLLDLPATPTIILIIGWWALQIRLGLLRWRLLVHATRPPPWYTVLFTWRWRHHWRDPWPRKPAPTSNASPANPS